ncbi:MAG: beta-glucuronidase [Ruminococcus sp.]|nr:beta-glucuronidase [Ruminococcus sp.]
MKGFDIMTAVIDLSGEWKLALDKERKGVAPEFDDTIILPNTTSNADKGEENTAREEGFLTDTRLFEGDAWFSKTVDLSECASKVVKLKLERTRITKVFFDGIEVGTQDSLTTAHIYDLTKFEKKSDNCITICVSNVGYPTGGGHLTSPDTQTNWNGITGEIALQIYNQTYAEDLRIYPLVEEKAFRVKAKIHGAQSGKAKIWAQSTNAPDGKTVHKTDEVYALFSGGELNATLLLGDDTRLWDEYNTEYYRVYVEIDGDVISTSAGLREFKSEHDKFYINGRKTFLRGKHDGLIFPKTGFAPCDVDEWIRVLSISKSYGINHYRFHTCCPPDAAFEAADIVGIYMEPQLEFWGTIQAPDEDGFNEAEQNYLIAEGFRMLSEFGNHPSFCMMSLGNELWGSKERLNEIVGAYKKFDGRHLYTQGSNTFQWFPNVMENDDYFVGVRLAKDRLIRGSFAMCDAPLGHIQTDKPATTFNYDEAVRPSRAAQSSQVSADGTVQIQYGTGMKTVKASDADADFIPDVPIVTHEIGQYETYPDYKEIEKYIGSIKARNFEVFRERLEAKGLLSLADDYFKASGALAVACYKEELESVFRSKTLGGFQLLDLQDFSGQGTALVGVLDAFMEQKGTCTPEQWREFCNDAVILAQFDDYCLESGQSFSAAITLTSFRPSGIDGKDFEAVLTDESGKVLARTMGEIRLDGENYIELGKLEYTVSPLEAPEKLTLSLKINDTDVKNHYELVAFPKHESIDIAGAYIFDTLDKEAEKLLGEGKTVLIVPNLESLKNSIEGFYCQDFWCYHMFRLISEQMGKPEPVGTMGLLIDNAHPALAHFKSEKFSTPQWWSIVQNSRSEILDGNSKDKNVIVRTIDNFERNHDLALLYEYNFLDGKVVICNVDLEKAADSAEGRQFIYSLLEYVKQK